MIWSINQFPELDHLDPHQRSELLANLPRWTYWTIVGRSLLWATLLGSLIAGFLFRSTSLEAFIATRLALIAAVATVVYLAQLRRLRRLMRAEIAIGFQNQRLPFCFHCGYDLRASDAPLCPECGRQTIAAHSPPSPH